MLDALSAVVGRLATMLPGSSPAATPSKEGTAKRGRDEVSVEAPKRCEDDRPLPLTPPNKRACHAGHGGTPARRDPEGPARATAPSPQSTRRKLAVLHSGVDGTGGHAAVRLGRPGEEQTPHTMRKSSSTSRNAEPSVRDAATASGGADGSSRKRLRASGTGCAGAKKTEGGKGKEAASPKKRAAAGEASVPLSLARNWTPEERAERRSWIKEELRKVASRGGGDVLVGNVAAWEQATDTFTVKYDDGSAERMNYECMQRHVLECKSLYRERVSWVDQRVEKEFFDLETGKSFGLFLGTVHEWAGKTDVYIIEFDDGQEEVLSYEDTKSLVLATAHKRKRKHKASGRQGKTLPLASPPTCAPALDCKALPPLAPTHSIAGLPTSSTQRASLSPPGRGRPRSGARSQSSPCAKGERARTRDGEDPHASGATQAGAKRRDDCAQASSSRRRARFGSRRAGEGEGELNVGVPREWRRSGAVKSVGGKSERASPRKRTLSIESTSSSKKTQSIESTSSSCVHEPVRTSPRKRIDLRMLEMQTPGGGVCVCVCVCVCPRPLIVACRRLVEVSLCVCTCRHVCTRIQCM